MGLTHELKSKMFKKPDLGCSTRHTYLYDQATSVSSRARWLLHQLHHQVAALDLIPYSQPPKVRQTSLGVVTSYLAPKLTAVETRERKRERERARGRDGKKLCQFVVVIAAVYVVSCAYNINYSLVVSQVKSKVLARTTIKFAFFYSTMFLRIFSLKATCNFLSKVKA